MKTYTVIKAEPLYSGSTKIVAIGLPINAAVKQWLALAKAYRADPDNNCSYAEIKLELDFHEYADEDIMWGCSLDDAQVIDETGYHHKDYVYIRSVVSQRTKQYQSTYVGDDYDD